MTSDKIEETIAYLRSIQQSATIVKHDELKQFFGNLLNDLMREIKEMHTETLTRLDQLERLITKSSSASSQSLPPVPLSPQIQKVHTTIQPLLPPVMPPLQPTSPPIKPTEMAVLKEEMLVELDRLKKIMRGG